MNASTTFMSDKKEFLSISGMADNSRSISFAISSLGSVSVDSKRITPFFIFAASGRAGGYSSMANGSPSVPGGWIGWSVKAKAYKKKARRNEEKNEKK